MAHNESLEYVVVMRASTCARILPEPARLRINQVPSSIGPFTLTFRTRFVDEGLEAKVPRQLWVEARGLAESVDAAVRAFHRVAGSITVLLRVAANAATGPLQVHVAFDNTLGKNEHTFLQHFLPEEAGLPRPIRIVPIQATLRLLRALIDHSEFPRLHRAAAHYDYAIGHWGENETIVALNYLFIGIENLKYVALERERQVLGGVSDEELASRWQVRPGPSGRIRRGDLEAYVRRMVFFRGDTDTHKKAERASDAFEHGYESIPWVQENASAARDSTARYLRQAILELCDVDSTVREELLAHPYDSPMSLDEDSLSAGGTFIGPMAETLRDVLDYSDYPMLIGTNLLKLKSLTLNETSSYDPSLAETTVKVSAPSDAIQFRSEWFVVKGQSRDSQRKPG